MNPKFSIDLPKVKLLNGHLLTLFLPGEGGISPLIVYHVTTSVVFASVQITALEEFI